MNLFKEISYKLLAYLTSLDRQRCTYFSNNTLANSRVTRPNATTSLSVSGLLLFLPRRNVCWYTPSGSSNVLAVRAFPPTPATSSCKPVCPESHDGSNGSSAVVSRDITGPGGVASWPLSLRMVIGCRGAGVRSPSGCGASKPPGIAASRLPEFARERVAG